MKIKIHQGAVLLCLACELTTFALATLVFEPGDYLKHPDPQPPFEGIRYAEGSFRLLADSGTYRSEDGIIWDYDTEGSTFFSPPGTRIGDLWFTEESRATRNIFASPDGIDWVKTEALELPTHFANETYTFLSPEGAVSGYYGSHTIKKFAYSEDGIDWKLVSTNLPPLAILADYIGGKWVAIVHVRVPDIYEYRPEIYASADGIDWQPVSAPVSSEEGVYYNWWTGDGVLLLLEHVPDGNGGYVLSSIHSTDLVNWERGGFSFIGGQGFCHKNGKIKREGESYLIQSTCVVYSQGTGQSFPVVFTFQTDDFEVFEQIFPLPTDTLPTSASSPGDPGIQIEILRESSSSPTYLEITTTDGEVIIQDGSGGLGREYITSTVESEAGLFASTPTHVYHSLDGGRTWNSGLEWDGYLTGPSETNYFQESFRGFHDLTVWNGTVWVVSNPKTHSSGEFLPGGLWRWAPHLNLWFMERSLPGNECEYLFSAGDRLCISGWRDGQPFVDMTSDMVTWDTHTIPYVFDQFLIKYVKDRFWLLAADMEYPGASPGGSPVKQGWVYSSPDLETWKTELYSDSFGFRDIDQVGDSFVVSKGNFAISGFSGGTHEVWISTNDGSWSWTNLESTSISGEFSRVGQDVLFDAKGYYTLDGIEWTFIPEYLPPVHGKLLSTGDGLLKLNNQFGYIHAPRYGYVISSFMETNTLQRLRLVDETLARRDFVFSKGEAPRLDKTLETDWGDFEHIGAHWYAHRKLGYLYAPDNSYASQWFWAVDLGWIWLDPDLHPYSFIHDTDNWVYWDQDRPGALYDYGTTAWTGLPLAPGRDFFIQIGRGLSAAFILRDTFMMGAQSIDWQAHPDEKPIHPETVESGFWIATRETTQSEFLEVMGFNPTPEGLQDPVKPVVRVSREEAIAYCRQLTSLGHTEGWLPPDYEFSLPTEAQWEYAAGLKVDTCSATPYSSDIQWENLPAYANAAEFDPARPQNYRYDSPGNISPVGQYPAISADFQLHDMMGNVWEWCLNDYYRYDPQGDYPEGSINAVSNGYQAARGGGWFSHDGDLRICNRTALEPGFRGDDLGFRVVIVGSIEN